MTWIECTHPMKCLINIAQCSRITPETQVSNGGTDFCLVFDMYTDVGASLYFDTKNEMNEKYREIVASRKEEMK